MEEDLEKRAERALQKLKATVPRDTGDLANSLRVETRTEKGKKIVRIVSDDPQIKEILGGTKGPYDSVPPWGPGSALGGWASRHGFTTNKSKYMLARSIARHGTKPAGSFSNKQEWIRDALREISR